MLFALKKTSLSACLCFTCFDYFFLGRIALYQLLPCFSLYALLFAITSVVTVTAIMIRPITTKIARRPCQRILREVFSTSVFIGEGLSKDASNIFIIFISRGMVEVRGNFGFTNDSVANIVIGLVYFCVIACSFFITYRVVFRKSSAKTAQADEKKGGKDE